MEIHPSLWTDLLGIDKMYDHVVAALITFVVCTLLGLIVKSRISLVPSGVQQFVEVALQGILAMVDDNIGPEGRKYMPLIGTLAFFIFVSNLMGLVPTFSAATGNLNTTVACAVIVFLYYNWLGLKEHGIGYIKHFMGPMPAIAWLMFPIEIISHVARPFSLSMRLFGNISGEHSVSAVFYGLIPFLLPVPLMALGLFAAFLQTFIFIMLTMVYIAGSLAHDH